MAFRKHLQELLLEPRSASSLARELGLRRAEVEDDLAHLVRSARAAGHDVTVVPAKCKTCGFTFAEERLSKPGKCPQCRGSRIFEPMIRIEPGTMTP